MFFLYNLCFVLFYNVPLSPTSREFPREAEVPRDLYSCRCIFGDAFLVMHSTRTCLYVSVFELTCRSDCLPNIYKVARSITSMLQILLVYFLLTLFPYFLFNLFFSTFISLSWRLIWALVWILSFVNFHLCITCDPGKIFRILKEFWT